MNSQTIIIRADASPHMGTGHVMRCVALAQAAQTAGLEVRLVCRTEIEWLKKRLSNEVFSVDLLFDSPSQAEDPSDLLQQLQKNTPYRQKCYEKPAWVILDGYHFNTECQKAIMRAGYRLMVIDDYAHLDEYHCDILLNQNVGAEKLEYSGFLGQKLLGLRYALLRQEFSSKYDGDELPANFVQRTKNILITLGGGDFVGILSRIANDLSAINLEGWTVRIIQGSMDENAIRSAFDNCSVNLEILPPANDMAEIISHTDICITAGGSTCWELCATGVPFTTMEIAENQKEICNWLNVCGYAKKFSRTSFVELLINTNYRIQQGLKLKKLVDAKGARRVIENLSKYRLI